MDEFADQRKREPKTFFIKSVEDLDAYHEWRVSQYISLLEEAETSQDLLSKSLQYKILFNEEFKKVFYEWFEKYYNPHPFPPLDNYQNKIDQYASQLASFFPEDQKMYWQDFFSQALFELSNEDIPGIRFMLDSGNYRTDIHAVHQGVHRLLYESSFSPLLNVMEKNTADRFTYIVSCKNVELCRVWIDRSNGESGIMPTWRTQTILEDVERKYIMDLLGNILVEYGEVQKQARILLQVDEIIVDENEMTIPNQPINTSQKLKGSQLSKLGRKISELFNEDELRDLVRKLDIDYENLSGDNKLRKAHELVENVDRNRRVPELLDILREERPRETWSIRTGD
ncbi:hypothetical protein [Candidatus Leptofilum sp.]|uniref:hypothetical protein n=1 Tax=Candidatus Leptofilum sp. TaxID=3241576 RepID=UPI003B593CB9